jgi:hypothetical protein
LNTSFIPCSFSFFFQSFSSAQKMALPFPIETPTHEKSSTPNLTPTPKSTPKSEIDSPESEIDTSNSGSSTPKSVRAPLSPAEAESEAEPRTPLKQIRKFKPPAVPPSVIRLTPWTPAVRKIGKCAVHGYFRQSATTGHRRLQRTCPCDL